MLPFGKKALGNVPRSRFQSAHVAHERSKGRRLDRGGRLGPYSARVRVRSAPGPFQSALLRKAFQRSNPQTMPGRANAVKSGKDLEVSVSEVGAALGLVVESQVAVGRRIWGARRQIDVVLKHPETRISLGIECKYQGTTGSAEEKIPATIEDIQAWPIRGIVVFAGEGFSENIKAYLLSTGKAVELCDLKKWLELYFGL